MYAVYGTSTTQYHGVFKKEYAAIEYIINWCEKNNMMDKLVIRNTRDEMSKKHKNRFGVRSPKHERI